MKLVILPVQHVRQRAGGECVAACAAMVLGYMGIEVDYDRLKDLLRVNWFGTPFFRLRELEQLGITVVYKQVYLNDPEFPHAPIPVSIGDFDLAWLERDELYATFKRRG